MRSFCGAICAEPSNAPHDGPISLIERCCYPKVSTSVIPKSPFIIYICVSTSSREGRSAPVSIFRRVSTAQPIACATSCRVKPQASRRRMSRDIIIMDSIDASLLMLPIARSHMKCGDRGACHNVHPIMIAYATRFVPDLCQKMPRNQRCVG